MTQSIVVQVGQCGNQIGCRFWDLALQEYATINKSGKYDECISSFFRNVDTRYEKMKDLPVGKGKIKSLKARAVLIDMEEGVINETLNGPLKEIFDDTQLITDVSGCGNNWATGHLMYGRQYHDKMMDTIRHATELCDSLQCFFLLHSMGGGTGSGIGTYVLRLLEEHYPKVYRFTTAVYPSNDDDVITSPYNSVLAMHQLTEHADCVLPIENQALIDIINKIYKVMPSERPGKKVFNIDKTQVKSAITSNVERWKRSNEEKPFDHMNNIVANLLLNLTSSARFEGSLNVDLNEITMNLVPFPKLHYLVSSLSPLYSLLDVRLPVVRFDEMFSDAFSKEHQLIQADPKHNLYLACALIVRGKADISDIRRNIQKIRPQLKFIHWNEEGWKTGLCNIPPVGLPYSLLTLANNTCITNTFHNLKCRFVKLYRRKAHIHHYQNIEGFEQTLFEESLESLNYLNDEYQTLNCATNQPLQSASRLHIL